MDKIIDSDRDAENPEWTASRIKNSVRLDGLPESLQAKLRRLGTTSAANQTAGGCVYAASRVAAPRQRARDNS